MILSDSISKNTRGAALGEVLRAATELFDDAAKVRPDAKNVLVVIADKKSDSRGEDLKKEAMKSIYQLFNDYYPQIALIVDFLICADPIVHDFQN